MRTRVATYARFSTDLQNPASVDDQLRECRRFAERQGWEVVAEFSDAAVSGATLLRRGVQALIQAALRGSFDVVVSESLDRLSRDQEDIAGLFKRLSFAGVRIVTISEGDIGLLHIGLKGTMAALYLKELAEKTRRGLRGRVEAGKSGGGRSYGYCIVAKGEFAIVPKEAAVIRDIFERYVAGQSPKAVAKTFNEQGIPGPAGSAWSPSTIHGHPERGVGILNNQLYIGRRVWNRLRYVKDPTTGKRVSRPNPSEAWVTTSVPDLRIISDELWQAAKVRQAATRHLARTGLVRARRPTHLFTGLVKCAVCKGGFMVSSRDSMRCFNAVSRGTCSNTRAIARTELEVRVLVAIQTRLLATDTFRHFCEGYVTETNRLRQEQRVARANAPVEIARLNRRSKEILELLLRGFSDEAWKQELREIEARRRELESLLQLPPEDAFALHPNLAEVYEGRVTTLVGALKNIDEIQRDRAREAVRALIVAIKVPPEGDLRVAGDLGAMLERAAGDEPAAVGYGGCGGSQPSEFGVPLVGRRTVCSKLNHLGVRIPFCQPAQPQSRQILTSRTQVPWRILTSDGRPGAETSARRGCHCDCEVDGGDDRAPVEPTSATLTNCSPVLT